MGYYLLDHPNPNGPHYYTTRQRCQHGILGPHLIVIHTAESMPDFNPPDLGAESVARYGATATRPVSWHDTIDSDSTIPMLPKGYTAFHVQGFNRCGYGIEIATRAASWASTPYVWKYATMQRLAARIKEIRGPIPARVLTRRQVDAGEYGIVGHNILDPTRRSDPGADFDWRMLTDMVGGSIVGDEMEVVKMIQDVLRAEGFTGVNGQPIAVDGVLGPDTRHAFDRMVQAAKSAGVATGLSDSQLNVLSEVADQIIAMESDGGDFVNEAIRLIRAIHRYVRNE